MRTLMLAISLMAPVSQANALDITEQLCTDAVSGLGLTTSPYVFKDGWLKDKHVFAGKTECYKKGEHVYISSEGQTMAEDGYFGLEALEARDVALSIQTQKVASLKKERDREIKDAKNAYDSAVSNLDVEVQGQLQEIRDNKLPTVISTALAIERDERKAAAELKVQKEAARDADRKRKKAERIAANEQKKANKVAEELERKRRGFHCLSGWNGSQRSAVIMVEEQLNDPDSFEHDQTRVAPLANGRHNFQMRYRAKNGFGGVMVGNATGSYSHTDCTDVIFTQLQ